ncbi:heavy metal translocating P-type ATPase [Oleiagrimonas sp. MCCC 1A03011]|uniref:heavy metal translocating P-type ATPase n=1 Tax=Oleiagrimonas sp. MCCC 1A03011 TaxID=1926883 RepID=UPI000DDB7B6C|nr:heavy metal translocating P-type ATPase [Oleiagrimonas sp. MCCC 1A03011]
MVETMLHVSKLDSPHRVLDVEKRLYRLSGVRRVRTDVSARQVRVTFDAGELALPRLLDACEASGCAAEPMAHEHLDDATRTAHDDALKRMLVAGLFGMQAMMFACVLYIGRFEPIDASTLALFRWLGLLAAAPVVSYAAWPFYRHAMRGLRRHRPDVDTPIAVAASLVYLASVYAAVTGRGEVYFDSVSMLVFVLLLGRYLALRARKRHRALGQAMAATMPLVCRRRDERGHLHAVAVSELQEGDRVHVDEGGRVPVDGVLHSARVRLDEACLTGESRPCLRRRGEDIVAGSLVLDGPLELRVGKVRLRAASALPELPHATHSPSRVGVAKRDFTHVFGVQLLALTMLVALGWLYFDPGRAFDVGVAVLVVACPCAFALAEPATLTRAMMVLARRGVLVTKPEHLQSLTCAHHLFLDKTGTLTMPALTINRVQAFVGHQRDDVLRAAVALARESAHPLARALVHAIAPGDIPIAEDVTIEAGGGIRGRVEGRYLSLGRRGFNDTDVDGDADDDALWLFDEDEPIARLPFADQLRPSVPDMVKAFVRQGMTVTLASGDSVERVGTLASRLGIRDWHARQTPADKLARVEAAQAHGDKVVMLGDGINDAAALAAADVAVSLLEGTDLARVQAGLILTGDIGALVQARQVAVRAGQILRQNRRWALAYNVCAVPLAACGLMSPWLAVLAMSVSSLGVVLNAMRLRLPSAPAGDDVSVPGQRVPA